MLNILVTGLISQIPLNNKTYYYGELNVKDYKTLLKCLIGDFTDGSLFLNLNSILEKNTSLTKDEILNLDLIEYLKLLINIRVTSIGSMIFALYQDEEKKTKLQISLSKALEQLEQFKKEYKVESYKDNNIEITFDIPTVNSLINNNFSFVKEIKFNNNSYNNTAVDELPAKYILPINSFSSKIQAQIEKYYFFKSPVKMFSISLSLEPKTYLNIIKILFNENLISIYENIFYLSKICNLNSEYLENCTYGEFKIFVKKAEELLKKNSKPQIEAIPAEPDYEPVDINSLYTPPPPGTDVTPSEFMKM